MGVEWHENVGFVTGHEPPRGAGRAEPDSRLRELDDAKLAERLDRLEMRQATLGQGLEALAAVVARINGELVRCGALSEQEGLAVQDRLGAVARAASPRN